MLKTSFTKFICLLLAAFLPIAFLKAQKIDKPNNALIVKFKSPDHRVQDVAFSPDGKLIAAGYGFYDDGGITVWNIADKAIVAAPLGAKYKSGIERVAFSSDGKLFAAASDRGDVLLWTVGSWRTPKTVLTKRGDTTDLSFSPDSTKIAYSSDKAAIVYDVVSGKTTVVATARNDFDSFTGISFSPDGKSVIVCGGNSIRVWDAAAGKIVKEIKPASSGFFGRLSPDGKHIISGGGAVYGEKSVEIRNFPDGRKINELTDFRDGLFALAISHSGKLFAVGGGTYGSDNSLSVWNLEEATERGFASSGDFPIQGLDFSRDDRYLAAADESGYVLIYDVERFRGAQVKKQDTALCGEIAVEDGKTYIVPLSKVPTPMRAGFQFPWRLEIVNTDSVTTLTDFPVVFQNWSIESSAGADRARVAKFKPLLSEPQSSKIKSDYIIFGAVQNPGWNEGFVAKLFADGSFVAADNSGKCLSYGNVKQLGADFQTVKKRLTESGFLAVPKEPLTLGADHYRTLFIEVKSDGASELRSDADSIEVLLSGGAAKKREAFRLIYNQEEAFLKSLLNAGMKSLPSKN